MIDSLCLQNKIKSLEERASGLKFIAEISRPVKHLPPNAAVRLQSDVCQPFKTQLRSINNQLRSLPKQSVYDVFWLDLGNQPLYDWYRIKELSRFFFDAIRDRFSNFEGIGLSSYSMMIPGDREGHFSLEYLNSCFNGFPETKQKWVSIPFSPLYADYYRDQGFYLNSQGKTFFEVCRGLGFNLQADIPEKNGELDRLIESGLLNDLPGTGESHQFLEFLKLFPQVRRVRIPDENYITVKDILLNNSHSAKSRTTSRKIVRTAINARNKYNRLPKVRSAVKAAYETGVVNRLELIELLCVLTGRKKVMRTTVRPAAFNTIADFLNSHGIAFERNESRINYRKDRGKGGWSNLYDPQAKESAGAKEYLMYIGLSKQVVNRAAKLEKKNDESFGEILSYPDCCRAAFSRNLPYAVRKQGDLVPIVADQTPTPAPWSYLLNIGGRYFERSLISFYPCTLDCREARKIANETLKLVKKYIPEYETELVESLKSPVLYTEYFGVYMFLSAKVRGNIIEYSPGNLRMTTANRIGADLKHSRRLVIHDMHHVSIQRGPKIIRTLQGSNVRALVYE
jgi:hypothetical protein